MKDTKRDIVTSPLEFSAAQLWEWIKEELNGRRGILHLDQCDEDIACEIDYEVGKLIEAHLRAVANGPTPDA